MSRTECLPPLRLDVDFLPSSDPQRPGLVMRDSMQFATGVLLVPPLLVQGLSFFDGRQTAAALAHRMVELTGDPDAVVLVNHLRETLSENGFLVDERFAELRERRVQLFRSSPEIAASHAGSGYPDQLPELRATLQRYLAPETPREETGPVRAVAAPHVSLFGGWESYRAAYRQLGAEHRERTFIVLGTSHYGEPDKFGLTRRPFRTPLGVTRTDNGLVDALAAAAPGATTSEDYCFSFEHSIEFQVIYLQWLFGPEVRVAPVLCGSFARSISGSGLPEDDDGIARFLGELGELAAKRDFTWVLGIDLAHQGRRYGDVFEAVSGKDAMVQVERRDRERLERVTAGDARGYWNLVQERRDDLRWCGASPLYTFLKAAPGSTGTVHRYEQWNIDDASVVSFAGVSFREAR